MDVFDKLSPIHALPGTSSTFQTEVKCGYNLLFHFEDRDTDQVILSADKLLVVCVSKNSEMESFHDLRFETYFHLDLAILSTKTSSTHLHVKQAYLQCCLFSH